MPFINDVLEHNRERLAETPLNPRPVSGLQSRFLFEPQHVMAVLRSRLVGQEAVLAQIEAMLNVVKADIGDRERPLAVNLFMGPTGVGKTELVRLLALAIHGKADAFCRIDMNTLAQEHYAAALTGAPPGYVGSKEGTTLFDEQALAGSFSRPGIVLFDELEKASTEVLRSLLNVLDSGRLTLTAGSRTLDFRNSLIFMTSNIGAEEARTYRQRFEHGWRRLLGVQPTDEMRVLTAALHRRFDPEFINRIDRIVNFQRIGAEHLQDLLDIELAKLNQRLGLQGRSLVLTAAGRQLLCARYDGHFGARDLARAVRTQLEPALAEALLNEPHALSFEGDALKGQWLIRVQRPA
jgi:ATP-dependent Clp protease ATP-binding subunit ClpA